MIGFGICGLLPNWLARIIMIIASCICFFIEATDFVTGYGLAQRGLVILFSPMFIIALIIIFKNRDKERMI